MNDAAERERWLSPFQKRIISSVITIGMVVVALASGLAWLVGLVNLIVGNKGMFSEHFPAVLGLPAVAGCSYVIIVTLKHTEGPIKLQGLGFKFEGAAGQAVLWLICTLGLAGAIKMLW